eukprot:scaffold17003_cov41-Attheya_sp.AAC.2
MTIQISLLNRILRRGILMVIALSVASATAFVVPSHSGCRPLVRWDTPTTTLFEPVLRSSNSRAKLDLRAVFDPTHVSNVDMTPDIMNGAIALLAQDSLAAAEEQAQSHGTAVVVFVIGLIPFGWATVEFWRRIAVGASFGTGKEAVTITIGEDDAPQSSRGRQVLGKGALVIAYVLFAIAAGSIGLALYSVISAPLLQQ